jgi:hypothetical protein
VEKILETAKKFLLYDIENNYLTMSKEEFNDVWPYAENFWTKAKGVTTGIGMNGSKYVSKTCYCKMGHVTSKKKQVSRQSVKHSQCQPSLRLPLHTFQDHSQKTQDDKEPADETAMLPQVIKMMFCQYQAKKLN